MRVEAVRTPTDPTALGRALALAWFKLWGRMPERPSINLLMAQWAQETARGRSCFNFCLGNVKATDKWEGDFCERYCNELLTETQANSAFFRAGKRDDGTSDVTLGATVGNLRIVNFYPPNPASRFRAFDTLEDGALDYLAILADRFASAWSYLEAGDADGFAYALHRSRYFTADPKSYAAGLVSLAREYSHLTIDLSLPEADIAGRLAADQDAILRAFTPEDK